MEMEYSDFGDQYHSCWSHQCISRHGIGCCSRVNFIYSISQEICTRFVVLCFVVVMQSFIMNSHEVFIHIHQGCFAGTGAIVRLPQCQWSKLDGYGKISQCTCITTTKQKPCAYFLGYTVLEWSQFQATIQYVNKDKSLHRTDNAGCNYLSLNGRDNTPQFSK